MKKELLIKFNLYNDLNGSLCVYESYDLVPFEIKRVFTVTGGKGDIRGNHAHKRCSQLLVCMSGKIKVTVDNGSDKSEYLLENMGQGLLIPPKLWASESYIMDGSILMVLCDRLYEEEDYIHDYNKFKTFVGIKESI